MVRKTFLLMMTLLLGIVLGQRETLGAMQAPDIKTQLVQLEKSLSKLKESLKYLKKDLISLSINMLPDGANKDKLEAELRTLNIQLQALEAEKQIIRLNTPLKADQKEELKKEFQNLDANANTTVIDKAKNMKVKTAEGAEESISTQEQKEIVLRAIPEIDAIKELNKILTKKPQINDELSIVVTGALATQALSTSKNMIENAQTSEDLAISCFNLINLLNLYESNKADPHITIQKLNQAEIRQLIKESLSLNKNLTEDTYEPFLKELEKKLDDTPKEEEFTTNLKTQVSESRKMVSTLLSLKKQHADQSKENKGEALRNLIKEYNNMKPNAFTEKFIQIISDSINGIINNLSTEEVYNQIKLHSQKNASDLSDLANTRMMIKIANKAYPHVKEKFSKAEDYNELTEYFNDFTTIMLLNKHYADFEKINNFISLANTELSHFNYFLFHDEDSKSAWDILERISEKEELISRIKEKITNTSTFIQNLLSKQEDSLENIIDNINKWTNDNPNKENIDADQFNQLQRHLQKLLENYLKTNNRLNSYKKDIFENYFKNYLNTQYDTINIRTLPPQITETQYFLTLVPILNNKQWENIRSTDPIVKAVRKAVLNNKNLQEIKKAFTKAKEKVKADKQAKEEGKITQKTMFPEEDDDDDEEDDDDDDDESAVESTTLLVTDLVKPDEEPKNLFNAMIKRMKKNNYLQDEEITARDDTQAVQNELSALVKTFIELYEKEEENKFIVAQGQETVKEAEKIKHPWETEKEVDTEEKDKRETRADLLARKKSIEQELAQLSGETTTNPYSDKEIKEFEEEIDNRKKEVAKLKHKIKELRQKKIEVAIKDKKEKLKENIDKLKELIKDKEERLRRFQSEQETVETEIKQMSLNKESPSAKLVRLGEKKAEIFNIQNALNAEQTKLKSLEEELLNLLGENATTFMQKSIEEEKEKLKQEIKEEEEELQELEQELKEIKNPKLSQDAYKSQAKKLIKNIDTQLEQLPSEEEIKKAEEALDIVRNKFNMDSKKYKNLMITFISSIGNKIRTASNQVLLQKAIKPLFNVFMEHAQNSKALPSINEISEPQELLPILLNLTPHTLQLEAFYQATTSIKDHIRTTLRQPPLVSSPETSDIEKFYQEIIKMIDEIINHKIENLKNHINNVTDANSVATVLKNIFITKKSRFFDIYLTYHLKYQLTDLILTQRAIVTAFLSKYRSSTGTEELLSILDIIGDTTRYVLEGKILEAAPELKDSDAYTILTKKIEELDDTSKDFES